MGHHIKLEFKRFDIDKVGLGCRYDYVEVRDGNSRDSPSLGRHCGTSGKHDAASIVASLLGTARSNLSKRRVDKGRITTVKDLEC